MGVCNITLSEQNLYETSSFLSFCVNCELIQSLQEKRRTTDKNILRPSPRQSFHGCVSSLLHFALRIDPLYGRLTCLKTLNLFSSLELIYL